MAHEFPPVVLTGHSLTLEAVRAVALEQAPVRVHDDVRLRMERARVLVDKVAAGDKPVYGINTGFGALAEKRISKADLRVLQENLVRSHAVGVGQPLAIDAARALMLLRANTLAVGHSGCRPLVLETLVALLNAGVAPFVPSRGSVGASGDLAPLAHVAMLLIGEGEAFLEGRRVWAAEAFEACGAEPLTLQAKEGLALINGTQAMAAVGTLTLLEAERLSRLADVIGALSLDALKGTFRAFDPRIHAARPHPGQVTTAANLVGLLEGSEIMDSHKDCDRVQDPYSLRCMPQVHGATRDALDHVRAVFEREINSATDNPLVFLDGDYCVAGDDIISGGNFHGQPLALALDYLAIAAAELANISERRVEQMVNPSLSSGLPPFLAKDPGLNSGFMILQVTAASLINENKVLCHPASVDSIPSSASREDHVSMGMTSANKAGLVVENVRLVLGIELLCACQGVDLRELLPGKPLRPVLERVRRDVPFAERDRAFSKDLVAIDEIMRGDDVLTLAREAFGGLR
jgi:histidine ammonia-lyase